MDDDTTAGWRMHELQDELTSDGPEPEAGRGHESLSAEHRRMLTVDSGIQPEVIRARGYRTVTVRAELRRLGFSDAQARVPALLIPIHGVGGDVVLYQVRPDEPRIKDGKPIKYEIPRHSRMVLDVHPSIRRILGDPSVPLFVTEGVKKGDSLVSRGGCAVALLGVWNWRGTNQHGGKSALADWESIALNGRRVFLVFDSDVMLKAEVHGALIRLKAFLEGRGAQVALIYLPSGGGGEKVGADDFLAAGRSVDDLLAHATPTPRPFQRWPDGYAEAGQPSAQPIIEVDGRFMRDVTDDALRAIQRANASEPFIFRRGSTLVRLLRGGNESVAEALTVTALKGILDRLADFVRLGDQPARPPTDVVADILALPDPPLPRLEAIHTTPVFLPTGAALVEPGYYRQSGILVHFPDTLKPHAHEPDVDARSLLLDELLGDFPFDDESSRAHTLALLLQPFVLPLIDGLVPLFLIDAPARGTGKGLLADVVGLVVRGSPAPVMALPGDEDEVEKRITSLLAAGSALVLLDNITSLRSRSLAAVLTASQWQGRLLGKSQIIQVPNKATWMATGNNVEVSDELSRRVIPIRLDSGAERPEERTGFRHPNLPAWTLAHRTELVSACLSIIQRWVDRGMPPGDAILGRYERWAAVMGGILATAEVPGFLKNRGRLHAEADRETREWAAFCVAWQERYATLAVTAKDLFELAKERTLLLDVWGGRTVLGAQQRLGHALAARRDRVFGELKIRHVGPDSVTGNASYRVEDATDRNTENAGNAGRQCAPTDSRPVVSGVSGVLQEAAPSWGPTLAEDVLEL